MMILLKFFRSHLDRDTVIAGGEIIAGDVDIPGGITEAATALPVQIFLWADSPERGFLEKTSAAIMVLLGFLILMNLIAIILRRRLEIRW